MKIHKKYKHCLQLFEQIWSREININKEDLQKLQAQSKVDNNAHDEVDKIRRQKTFNYALAYGIIFLMFFIVLNYASQIAMEIASEKTFMSLK